MNAQEVLNACERRAVAVNGRLLAVKDALRRGNVEVAEALLEEAHALNWESRKAMLAAGAVNSIRADAATLNSGRDLDVSGPGED